MYDIRQMLQLYFIAGTQDCPNPTEDRSQNLLLILEQALQAGITCFQFRDKSKNSLEDQPNAQKALAIEIDADGVHVGQKDMSPIMIRQMTDKPLIIGLSNNTLEDLWRSEQMIEVDYCGLGPVFPTNSKEKHNPPIGLDFVKKAREAGIRKPIVSIGGVKAEHVATLKQNGADGIAVITAISLASDVSQAVKRLL
ncbi:thiamine phosphate synthase [Actinobacillus pleuropneumoniae]|uniref:Thiamine phosphate synthase n=1 Tax=Actinobacillus pleuropneumoniae TaxID=715 RepID=A0ABM6X3F3_ACTPL|nr:thiamine phosphate synthase [Actinobacillus pleuropneumoniae]ASU16507.1 Thiamine-phosphate synthase [Actinobacillus pleuropneumoniae]AWG94960.1 thiamine phosphate synthase [Actinobacillus pleuropneumoniae serovar 1 str. 4074]AXA21032.1 thiamine phosphate synthase [Actinobacillus pleuropneumoniae]EFM94605.1 Thiamine-phosphate pyrophosphorylase [Actinobacillus pleuropneumoniae serovar 9 str. CVJ13261]EFM99015.1 Thiamine-phosphate pyrophosphorylase [Actinobacillus pleuropneumoniae serovar 11 s